MSNFSIKVENGFTWFRLPRVIGLGDTQRLEAELAAIMTEGIKLVLDLAETCEIYSSGIGFIIQARKLVIEKNGSIFLVNVGRKIHEVFSFLNLDRVFRIYPTDIEFELDNDELWKNSQNESSTEFLFVSQIEDGIGRVIIAGNLDGNADVNGLRSLSVPLGVKWCLFDLSKLDVIDSFGMSEIQATFRKLDGAGCNIAVFGATTAVSGLFAVFQPPESVQFHTTVEEALSSISNSK